MKITVKILALATLILGFASTSFAQSSVTAPATASATLLAPFSIDKMTDMNFGKLAVVSTDGTVTLDYDGKVTPHGGVKLMGGTHSAASFTVTGEGKSTFSISYPTTITLTGSVSGSLTVSDILCDKGSTGSTGTLSDGGSLDLRVRGTLNVPANSVAGIYTNSTGLTVTVNYN